MNPPTSPSPGELAQRADLVHQVRHLEARLDLARSSSSEPELVADLETAYEELRVADEEVRAQQETITRLVQSSQDLRLQQERTLAIVPVPMMVTDMQGLIRSANAAAAGLAGMPVARLLGKPVFGLLALEDRAALRRLVSDRGRAGVPIRYAGALVPRGGEPVPVEMTGSVHLPGAGVGEISWLVLGPGVRQDRVDGAVTHALTELTMLPRRAAGRSGLLAAAADICSRTAGAEVTITLGAPAEPTAVASTSERAQECDGVQLTTGGGPSVRAHEEGTTVTSVRVAEDDRWPALHGRWPSVVSWAVATPIEAGGTVLGTITAYGSTGPEVAAETLELFAMTLGGVLHELELVEELERLELDMQRALGSRAVIDQAKGVLMAARGFDAEQAWAHLVALSSSEQRKVRDVADGIVTRAAGRP